MGYIFDQNRTTTHKKRGFPGCGNVVLLHHETTRGGSASFVVTSRYTLQGSRLFGGAGRWKRVIKSKRCDWVIGFRSRRCLIRRAVTRVGLASWRAGVSETEPAVKLESLQPIFTKGHLGILRLVPCHHNIIG